MRINLNLLRCIFGATSIPLFCLLTGCFHFYKASVQDKSAVAQNLNTPNYENRYFILRSGANAYYMNNIAVSEDRKTISCKLDTLSASHLLHLRKGRGGRMRYKANLPEAAVLNEVHIYIPTDSSVQPGINYSLPVSKIRQIEVIEKDKGRTTASYIIGGVGITAGVFAVIGVIILATKSSCPFISAYDGHDMKLQGEVYGGAIYPQLCRNDYLQLKMAPTPSGRLQLQISNELKEKQYTDLAELIVATHPKNVQVVADEKGNLHTISTPVAPIAATVAGRDVMPLITTENDNISFNFDDTLAAQENNNRLNLVFNRPAGRSSAKLILRMKNSYWLDLVYGKVAQGFGSYYPTYIKEQRKTSVEKLNQWKIEQQLPLQISMKTSEGWSVQRNVDFVGPVASREMAIPIDLKDCKSDKISIQLKTGFNFWEIDYAGIDFSADVAVGVHKELPVMAKDENGKDVTGLISREDGLFLEQPDIGNATVIDYAYAPMRDTSQTQTYFLHAKGYYEHIRNFTNSPDVTFLMQFKRPGAMSDFSRKLYQQAMNANFLALSNKQ